MSLSSVTGRNSEGIMLKTCKRLLGQGCTVDDEERC